MRKSDHPSDSSTSSVVPAEPEGGLPRLLFKLRGGGWAWLARRLRFELVAPSTTPGRALHTALRGAWSGLQAPLRALAQDAAGRDVLVAFYDLEVAPVTFDFLWFLAGADAARRRLGLSRIRVVIVPGRSFGLREERADYEQAVDREARRARIANILVPSGALLSTVCNVEVASSRREAAARLGRAGGRIYPRGYETALPVAHHPADCLATYRAGLGEVGVLRAPVEAKRAIARWLAGRSQGRRVVTITIRDYGYMPARDSNLAAWTRFARGLDARQYVPVFVPDTARTADDLSGALDGFVVCPEAARDVALRMALYEAAYLNLGVNSGPMALCWLNDTARYLTFKILVRGVPQASAAYIAALGFEVGRSLPFAGPHQKWVWEDDEHEVIVREFSAMAARIDGARGLQCASD